MKLPDYDWETLEETARSVVDECLAELPDEIEPSAREVPRLFHRWHPNAPYVDPEAVYMLGEYLNYGDDAAGKTSGVIALYIGAIAWYCDDEGLDFEEEVRTTFLHELGHHFGWDEEEVEQRGL